MYFIDIPQDSEINITSDLLIKMVAIKIDNNELINNIFMTFVHIIK
jgi:hypothetical protein